jgi:phage tail sheath gpL-like
MAISDAVGAERISRIIGYKLTKGDYSETSPNLPQRIALLAEANNANQSILSATGGLEPYRITSAKQAGDRYGYGSPIYNTCRILFPTTGGGLIGGIPVYIYPQLAAAGAAAKVMTVTASGTATAGGTHYVVINGRYSVDGGSYAVNIASGDTATAIAQKITDVVNNVLGSPVIASETSPVGAVSTLTAKWKGLTSQGITVSVDTGNNDLGVTYSIATTTPGTGTPSVTGTGNGLALFGNTWNTIVINTYGFVSATITELQSFNGIPDPETPTGRYQGIVFKPFLALTGTVEDSDTDTADVAICEANSTQVTIVPCPAPLSKGLAMEAAANACCLFARISQDTPHLDIEGKTYPDMPVATTTPKMASYDVRDAIVKMGMSTVDIVAGAYQVQDFVTTYHPSGEVPPQYRYARNLMLDFNVYYGHLLLQQTYAIDHMIANDADIVNVSKVIKPKQWKAILAEYAVSLASRGLIADPNFMIASITVGISTVNPDRLEDFFRYKRTGVARILATTAEAGFNFGTV